MIMRHDRPDLNTPLDEEVWPGLARFGGADGTAALVSPCWVLTAARTLAAAPAPDVVEFFEEFRRVVGVVRVPDPGSGSGEIVLLRLHAALEGVAPFQLFDGDDEAGGEVLLLGRGRHGDALIGPRGRGDGLLRRATNRVDGVDARGFWFTLDPPRHLSCTDAEGISGPGIGGDAALLPHDSGLLLAGIRISPDGEPSPVPTGYYGASERHARVAPRADWIRAVLAGMAP